MSLVIILCLLVPVCQASGRVLHDRFHPVCHRARFSIPADDHRVWQHDRSVRQLGNVRSCRRAAGRSRHPSQYRLHAGSGGGGPRPSTVSKTLIHRSAKFQAMPNVVDFL